MKLYLSVTRFFLFLLLNTVSLIGAEELSVREMSMRIMLAGVKPALEWQGEDGRYYRSKEQRDSRHRDFYNHSQMVIYPLAYLYITEHPLNEYYGDRRVLESVACCGDHLAELEITSFNPFSQWLMCNWLQAYELIEDELSPERRRKWKASFERWCRIYVDYLEKIDGKRLYTTAQLGTSPNHYSYFSICIYKAGQILQRPEWKELAIRSFKNLFGSQHQDGYWAENRGPVNRYVWHTLHGVGVYYALTGDPEALEAMRRAKDYLLKFTYPDGTPVSVIDERNRHTMTPVAVPGLLTLSHFPDGRRFGRLMTRMIFDRIEQDDNYTGGVTRYTDTHRYWVEGPEDTVPMELESYEARLVSGAYLIRRGDWYVTLSGIITPPWEGNRYFLDRYTYLEIRHSKTGVLIGGGLTKHQPQIATILMQQSNGSLDFRPRESRIAASGDSATIQLELDKFRASLEIGIVDQKKLKLKVTFIETTEPLLWPNRYECNLQLQLKPGDKVIVGSGKSYVLSETRLQLGEEEVGSSLESDLWRITVPRNRTSLRFPFLPFYTYNIDGYGGMRTAVGILSSYARIEEGPLTYLVEIK